MSVRVCIYVCMYVYVCIKSSIYLPSSLGFVDPEVSPKHTASSSLAVRQAGLRHSPLPGSGAKHEPQHL